MVASSALTSLQRLDAALEGLEIRWDEGPNAQLDSGAIRSQ